MRSWVVSLALLLGAAALPAAAQEPASLNFVLYGVTFADGGTATGFITLSPSTGTPDAWNISVQGGKTKTFPPVTFDPTNSTFLSVPYGNPEDTLIFRTNGSPERDLRLTPVSRLLGSTAAVPLNLHTAENGSGGVDCFNCAPFRLITAGQLAPSTNDSICGQPEEPLLRVQAHAEFNPGSGDKSLALYKSGKAVLITFIGSAAVDSLLPADFARIQEELQQARIGFAKDCAISFPTQSYLNVTARVTWFGAGGRENHFTVTTGGGPSCPAHLEALVKDLVLNLRVHDTV